jgi:hypothetical protein
MSLYTIMINFVHMFIFWICSMYERNHVAFVSLSLPYFTYHYVLQLQPLTFQPHVIIPHGWVKLHSVNMSHFLDPLVSCRAYGLYLLLPACFLTAVQRTHVCPPAYLYMVEIQPGPPWSAVDLEQRSSLINGYALSSSSARRNQCHE